MFSTIDHELRRRSIGASECSAVLGLNPWKTPLELYLDKIGMLPPPEATPRMQWGLRMEPVIGQAYSDVTGRRLLSSQEFVRHPDYDFMTATLDHRGVDRVVELKRVHDLAAKEFGEDGSSTVPAHYHLQLQQQMACTGLELADLAALIGHDDFRVFTVPRDDGIIAKLIEAEREFMDRVARRDAPLPDFEHPSTADLLKLIEPNLGKIVDLGDDALEWVLQFEAAGAARLASSKIEEAAKNRLIHAMGDAELAHLPDGRKIRRQRVERAGYAVSPSSYVSFKVLKESKK